MKKSVEIKGMAPLDFIGLDAVTPEENRLWYTDNDISESVAIPERHDDMTLWEDEALAKELQEKVVEAYEEDEKWEDD